MGNPGLERRLAQTYALGVRMRWLWAALGRWRRTPTWGSSRANSGSSEGRLASCGEPTHDPSQEPAYGKCRLRSVLPLVRSECDYVGAKRSARAATRPLR
jgi:hypothetical protein